MRREAIILISDKQLKHYRYPNSVSELEQHWCQTRIDESFHEMQDLLVTLSTLLRGSIYEQLRWTFKLYDINGDGCITRSELGEIVVAIHELMGRRPHQVDEDRKAREQVDRVFKKLDLNQDGVITIEEFIESCLKVSVGLVKLHLLVQDKKILSSSYMGCLSNDF